MLGKSADRKRSGLLAFLLAMAAIAPAQSDRRHIRIDDAWKFQQDAALPAGEGASLTWRWKSATETTLKVTGLPADISSGKWAVAGQNEDVFSHKPGFAWMAAELPWTKSDAPTSLHFEGVDDNVAVFVNGKYVMTHEGWDDAFDVPLKDVWMPGGKNTAQLLVQNENGGGGLNGPSSLEIPVPEAATPEASTDFNDSAWSNVHLPHDYVIDNAFDEKADTGHGSLPLHPAWYRRELILPADYKNRSVWISFDGVYRDSKVYLNGHLLGEHPSGYTSFRYDLTKYANFGGKNEIAVRVDPRKTEGWFYEGGGIYRHVWLNVANKVHVRPWGTYVNAQVTAKNGTATSQAKVTVETMVDNNVPTPQSLRIKTQVLSPTDVVVATSFTDQAMAGTSSAKVVQTIPVPAPTLWSIDNPKLYHVKTTIIRSGQEVDQVTASFGVRTVEFDANRGFFLNGVNLKIKGTCNHQDHAGVGIGLPDSLIRWRIRKLKEMGCNAYRCSHNEVAAEVLDACDRYGMVVMDENRHLGDTQSAKASKTTGYSDLTDLRTMITRDRNHPSVIMWSMCNEEPLQGTPEGAAIFKAMYDLTKSLDPTRPVTCAMNGGWGTGISTVQDLQGFNYGIFAYDDYHKKFPDVPVYGSETASAVSTRGEYVNDPVKGYVSAYDVNRPDWGQTAEGAWQPIATRGWMAGAFVWTGFDYKGEPTPYGWPCINSHFGILDICGFPKDSFYYYKAWWGSKPTVHILPHWNWDKPSAPIDVWCYSNGDKVELLLNGKSLGTKDVPAFGHVSFSVNYEPGELVAKSYLGGKPIATDTVATTGAPAEIKLVTDRVTVAADGEDVTLVEVQVVDSAGRVVPTADNEVSFAIQGDAKVVGVGNGDPSSHEPDRATKRKAFHGLCMALIGASGVDGSITVTASAPGLKSTVLKLNSVKSISR